MLARRDSRAAIPSLWLFVVETIVDLVKATAIGIRERAAKTAYTTTWLILDIYVPLLWITLALVVWRLVSQRQMHT